LIAFRTDFQPDADKASPPALFSFPHLPPSEHPLGSGMGNLGRPIPSKMARKSSRETATSAIWKITCRPQVYVAHHFQATV